MSNNKRRRIAAANGSPNDIGDLPSGILAHAASFLANPSKALFAVSLDENSPNERSTAIVGNQRDILDFGEIEKDLAAKLSDDDIEKMLLCIDAGNNVKRLKLANCTKITGAGLEPLRGSAVIELIDLSLVGDNQNPNRLDPESRLSCDYVLPILDSIIDGEGCLLKYIVFPYLWKKGPSADSELHASIIRYNQMLSNRDTIRCLECNQVLPRNGDPWIQTEIGLVYGVQFYTCYGCLRHYCYYCQNIDGVEMLKDCQTCQRDYCVDCIKMHPCLICGRINDDKNCYDCYKHECNKCKAKICPDCVQTGHSCSQCTDCNTVCCAACDTAKRERQLLCDGCWQSCCSDCRLLRFRQGELDCADCIKTIAPLLVTESIAYKRLKDEVDQLKSEIEELKRENKDV